MLQQGPNQTIDTQKKPHLLAPQGNVKDDPGVRARHCLLLWLLSLEFSSSTLVQIEKSGSLPGHNILQNEISATMQKIPAMLMSAARQVSAEEACIYLKKAQSSLLEVVKLFEFSVEYGCLLPTDGDYRDILKQFSALNKQLVALMEAC